MSLKITMTMDAVTPDLRKKIGAAARPQAVWRAVGTELVTITKSSFKEPGMRISNWSAKRDGQGSNLIKKGMLKSSIRIVATTEKSVTVGSDRKYAGIHQLGGVIRPKAGGALVFWSGGRLWRVKKVTIPARPFLPFTADGELSPKHAKKIELILDKAMQKHIGIA